MLPSFAIIDHGRSEDEKSCLWIEQGKFYGMGYISNYADVNDWSTLKSAITPYPSNDYIMNLITSYSSSNPQKTVSLATLAPPIF